MAAVRLLTTSSVRHIKHLCRAATVTWVRPGFVRRWWAAAVGKGWRRSSVGAGRGHHAASSHWTMTVTVFLQTAASALRSLASLQAVSSSLWNLYCTWMDGYFVRRPYNDPARPASVCSTRTASVPKRPSSQQCYAFLNDQFIAGINLPLYVWIWIYN